MSVRPNSVKTESHVFTARADLKHTLWTTGEFSSCGRKTPSCYTVADDKSYIVHLTNIVYVQNLSLLVIRVLLIEAVVGWYLQKSGYLSWCLNRDLKISAKAICSRSLHWLRDRIWRKAWIISILLSSWYILYSFTKADAYTCRLCIRL